MAQEEMRAMEEHSRLAVLHQPHGSQRAVQEYERRTRDAVNQAVFDSPARDTALSMEARAGRLNNESTMEMREREILSASAAELKQHCSIKESVC